MLFLGLDVFLWYEQIGRLAVIHASLCLTVTPRSGFRPPAGLDQGNTE